MMSKSLPWDSVRTKGMPRIVYDSIDHAIKEPLRFSHALVKAKDEQWPEVYFSTGLQMIDHLRNFLEASNISHNDTFYDISKAVNIFSSISQAMHTPFHLLNSEAGRFLEGIKISKSNQEKTTLKKELEEIVELIKPNVIPLAISFIEEAKSYGWLVDREGPWGNIGTAYPEETSKGIPKVERNMRGDIVDEKVYHKAVRTINNILNNTSIRCYSYLSPDSHFDESVKVTPFIHLNGEGLAMDEIYKRLREINPFRMMNDLNRALREYTRDIGRSANASRESKNMFLCMEAAVTQLKYVCDLEMLHALYDVREVFPGSREIIEQIYMNKQGGNIGRGILLAMYCTDILVEQASMSSGLLVRGFT